MKTIVAVILCACVVTYCAAESDYKYLGTLHNKFGHSFGNIVVITKYHTLTSRSAIPDEWTKDNNYFDAYVMISHIQKNIDKIYRENDPKDRLDSRTANEEFDLAVIKIKQEAGVDAIQFPPPRYVDFTNNPELTLLYRHNGLTIMPYKIDSSFDTTSTSGRKVYVAEVGRDGRLFERNLRGCPLMKQQYLVGIRTINRHFPLGTHGILAQKECVTSIYDHMKFLTKFLSKTSTCTPMK